MFDARMRADSIRLFVSKDTVSRHALISHKMTIRQKLLSKISLHQSGKELKLGQGDGVKKRRTSLSICLSTVSAANSGLRKAPVHGTYLVKTIT